VKVSSRDDEMERMDSVKAKEAVGAGRCGTAPGRSSGDTGTQDRNNERRAPDRLPGKQHVSGGLTSKT
jgi:hypothetical protein